MTTIILCGGAGTRLWPLSKNAFPKQFCDLLGGPSLFERTVARNAAAGGRYVVVTNRAHRDLAREQFRRSAPAGAVVEYLLEPVGRNTAPAIALACLGLPADESVLVVPSDHLVADEAAYRAAAGHALAAADDGFLATFGIAPAHPETGFGYIEAGERPAGKAYLRVAAFREKPDRATAETYLASGRHYWNSGMFAFRAGAFLEELGKLAPAILEASRAARAKAIMESEAQGHEATVRVAEADMLAIPSDSIDYAVMEKSDRAATVPADFGWSDLGSFDALYEARSKDGEGNALAPGALAVSSRNCMALGGGRMVVLAGVEDLVVVETADAVIVVKRGETQLVKAAVDAVKAAGGKERGLL
ncbi:MAG: mannose-1-phosphate guanylyltransferase [Spirochaetaceae bacterium]|nr:mannose-1-phosphate guanylyltransferase [Spirochaetaceae bacterium]